MLNKLVKKFQANSHKHLAIIFIVFALSGSSSLLISSPILSAINLKALVTYYPLYIFIRILIIIPIYQINLIIVATFFGEFKYFWKYEKKFLQRLKLIR
ncbi:hypothetical protein OAK51_05065 [Alphaproteobacteria bacterium]|nr:hypothetical protein [Alphaproteobacteria bacterium]